MFNFCGRETKVIRVMEQLYYEGSQQGLGLFSLEKGRLLGDLPVCKGVFKKHRDSLFNKACCIRTLGNGFKLKREM